MKKFGRQASAPLRPIGGAAAVMGNGDDTDGIALQPVNQGIGKTMKGKRPRPVRTAFAQRGELPQQPERSFDLVDEVVRRDECAFADIPVDGGIGVGLRLITKTDLQHSLRQGLLCEAGT